MGYQSDIGCVVSANVEEIQADLEATRLALRQARSDVDRLDRQVASLEGLLALVDDPSIDVGSSSTMTLHEAMAEVLRTAPEHRLRAPDLAAEIRRRGLYKMQDGRPVEPQQIHARVGNYSHLFTKMGTFICLVDGADA